MIKGVIGKQEVSVKGNGSNVMGVVGNPKSFKGQPSVSSNKKDSATNRSSNSSKAHLKSGCC